MRRFWCALKVKGFKEVSDHMKHIQSHWNLHSDAEVSVCVYWFIGMMVD